MKRRTLLQAMVGSRAAAVRASAAPIVLGPAQRELITVPDDPAQWDAFRAALVEWRSQARARLGYDDALYRRKDFAWVPSSFACCFLMLYDEAFYSPGKGRYMADEFLDQAVAGFGGFDSVVLWHAYPRIGLDDRNQFDMYRDMPGGLPGLREVSRICHARGVKVYIDYNPWDTTTRREPVDDLDALAAMVKAIDADGIFLDTMRQGAVEFRAKLDAARPGVALEPEGTAPLENVRDHHMSWAQGLRDSHAPGILRNKWLERRHMQHGIRRWDRDHTGELHTAWMNGSGMMVWENVFGSWVGWNARDRSMLRAMLPVQRRYAALFSGEQWTPLIPSPAREVFAGLWEGGGLRLWTLVNRAEAPVTGPLLELPPGLATPCFDLIRGERAGVSGRQLLGTIAPRGVAAFITGEASALGSDFREFLAGQRRLAARADQSTVFPARQAALRSPAPARTREPGTVPPGMVGIPPDTFLMPVTFRVRECGFYQPQTDIRLQASRPNYFVSFERTVRLRPYAIDLTPVTNAQYHAFLQAGGYRPRHPENFLKHWENGNPPAGKADHPVVYVDLDDARAYARWAGKRLPAEEEWQYAAQGPEQRIYPWGAKLEPGRCNGGESGGTTPVTAFPEGRSPFGCYDMCGNTWEWTESERSDGRTRWAVIRGGSYYRAEKSVWYMDGGPQAAGFAAKMLLLWPGLDRCATVGFRCAA